MSRERASSFAGDSPLRVAIVGAGFIADYHLQILRAIPGVEVTAVCDVQPDRAEAVAETWGVGHATARLEDLAERGVGVAHVLVPPDLHATVTRRLLELGIGAFVEKPLALERAAAEELCRMAGDRHLPLGVNHNNLFHPAFVRLRRRLESGALGRLEHVRLCWNLPLAQLEAQDEQHWMFRSPRNILFEQGPHPFSLVQALVGPVRSVTAKILGTRRLATGQVFHDRWSVAGQGRAGTADVYLSFGQGLPRATLEVLCSDGAVEADLHHNLVSAELKTQFLDFWNSFLAARRRGRALRRDAWRNVAQYLLYTLGRGARRDPFFVGMRDSIRAFYSALASDKNRRSGAERAVAVVEWCEEAATAAGVGDRETELPVLGARPARSGEVAVLGATGFIGRRVVAKLIERGTPVTAVVRRRHGLAEDLAAGARSGHLRLASGSLEDRGGLREALAGCRAVIHLATGATAPWKEVERSMVQGTVGVAELCLELGAERLIYVSSIAALYLGPELRHSVIEDSWQTDPRPHRRDLYSRGKIATEAALSRLHRQHRLPVVVARPGVVFGAGMPLQHGGLGLWVRDNHCVGWGRGDHPLPLVWVDDVAEALVQIADHRGRDLDGQALNLCARVPLTAAEIVAELREASGRNLVFHARPLWLSQAIEIAKWAVKRVGGRRDARFPAFRDLKSRALCPAFSSHTARALGWLPIEDRATFLERVVRPASRPPIPEWKS